MGVSVVRAGRVVLEEGKGESSGGVKKRGGTKRGGGIDRGIDDRPQMKAGNNK